MRWLNGRRGCRESLVIKFLAPWRANRTAHSADWGWYDLAAEALQDALSVPGAMDVGYATVVRERLAHGHDLKQSVRAAYSTEMRRKIKIVIEEAGRHPPAVCQKRKEGEDPQNG